MRLHRIDASTCNKIVLQLDLFHKEAKSCSGKFTKYDRHEEPLDSFCFTVFPRLHSTYPELSYLLKLILVLSHGQASVERGFSLRNSSLKDNISDLSTYSKRVIIDHMISNKIKASTMEFSTPMMVSYKSARTKYEVAKQKVTKEESQSKLLKVQINEIKAKISEIRKTVTYLDDEFTKAVFDAESKPVKEQSCLIAKATALKRKSNSKREIIKELEEQMNVLEKKRVKCSQT